MCWATRTGESQILLHGSLFVKALGYHGHVVSKDNVFEWCWQRIVLQLFAAEASTHMCSVVGGGPPSGWMQLCSTQTLCFLWLALLHSFVMPICASLLGVLALVKPLRLSQTGSSCQ